MLSAVRRKIKLGGIY